MSKGLGKVQKRIIEILKYEKERGVEWYDIGSLTYQVVNDYIKIRKSDYKEPTKSEQQVVYRAIRTLEKYFFITSRIRIKNKNKIKEIKILSA